MVVSDRHLYHGVLSCPPHQGGILPGLCCSCAAQLSHQTVSGTGPAAVAPGHTGGGTRVTGGTGPGHEGCPHCHQCAQRQCPAGQMVAVTGCQSQAEICKQNYVQSWQNCC